MDQILSELRQEIGKLEESIERLQSSSPVSSTSTINIVGGAGLSVAIACCVVSFIITIFVCITLNGRVDKQDMSIQEQNHKMERMQDYMNAIYAAAPQLKPKEQNP